MDDKIFLMKAFATKSLRTLFFDRIKRSLFNLLTKGSLQIFTRGGDFISYGPLVERIHEEALTNLISFYAKNGFSDYLIDIGANIGLTSCQNGNSFNQVICFEPNPLCANILSTNLAISLSNKNYQINNFALGKSDGKFHLFIPKKNWGGAFVHSSDNGYSDYLLASKDGYKDFEESNYLIESVKVRSAKEILNKKFDELSKSNLKHGIIKIDVEGYERMVLEGIAKSIPANFKAIIIFENWDSNLDHKEIKKLFSRKVKIKKLCRSIVGTSKSKLSKFFSLLLNNDETMLKQAKEDMTLIGDVIIELY